MCKAHNVPCFVRVKPELQYLPVIHHFQMRHVVDNEVFGNARQVKPRLLAELGYKLISELFVEDNHIASACVFVVAISLRALIVRYSSVGFRFPPHHIVVEHLKLPIGIFLRPVPVFRQESNIFEVPLLRERIVKLNRNSSQVVLWMPRVRHIQSDKHWCVLEDCLVKRLCFALGFGVVARCRVLRDIEILR